MAMPTASAVLTVIYQMSIKYAHMGILSSTFSGTDKVAEACPDALSCYILSIKLNS